MLTRHRRLGRSNFIALLMTSEPLKVLNDNKYVAKFHNKQLKLEIINMRHDMSPEIEPFVGHRKFNKLVLYEKV